MLFRCDTKTHVRVQLGDSVVAALEWPIAAPDGEPLTLLITGYVTRLRLPMIAISTTAHRLLRICESDKRFDFLLQRSDNQQETVA